MQPFLLAFLAMASNPAQVALWPNGAPGSEGKTATEFYELPNKEHDTIRVATIHQPSLTVMLAPEEIATGAAVVIAPGGGHHFLSWDTEGLNVGKYLNSIGVSAFVLKYRLANEAGSTYKVEREGLADVKRSLRLVRARASEFGVDPARVGVMGFSAGGELAALASTRFDAGETAATDPVDRLSSKPDFQMLIYPGGKPDAWVPAINKDTPPAFLLCADNDKGPSENIAQLYTAMKHAGVPVEVHVFATGGHGFGLRDQPAKPTVINTTWHLRLGEWLKSRGYLEKK